MSAETQFVRRGLVQFEVDLHGEAMVLEFRLPTVEDFAAVDEHLPVIAPTEGAEVYESPAEVQRIAQRARALLLRVTLAPRLVAEPHPGEGELFVGALRSEDLLAIAGTLRGLAGLGGAQAARLRPFSATAGSS